ncbi:hypothetical protein N7530_010708 [Penicillium desertorum]|uniref:Uncharacterized protein n=1 Tax=Penicillium desertorum TaxID=1303715 RepID=A0A9X0BHZ6_9EURO|nr:hypothetical protein N7530_010708 [Penicillium desertorum]
MKTFKPLLNLERQNTRSPPNPAPIRNHLAAPIPAKPATNYPNSDAAVRYLRYPIKLRSELRGSQRYQIPRLTLPLRRVRFPQQRKKHSILSAGDRDGLTGGQKSGDTVNGDESRS